MGIQKDKDGKENAMKTKLNVFILFGLLLSFAITPLMTVQADDKIDHTERKTKVGIGFEKTPDVPIVSKPIKYQPAVPQNIGQLPHTGEMLTSFIILLIGLSILIVFVGVANLKRVYYIRVLE